MSGDEAFHQVWMQNTGYWNPARKKRFQPVGEWLKKVVMGYYRYHALPGNLDRLRVFGQRIRHLIARSFATIRFFAVSGQTTNAPLLRCFPR